MYPHLKAGQCLGFNMTELTNIQKLDIVQTWFDNKEDIAKAMQVLTDFDQTKSNIDNEKIVLLDKYAIACLQGYMTGLKPAESVGPDMQDKIAGGIYSMAAAMFEARKKYL